MPIYMYIVHLAQEWNTNNNNVGIVINAVHLKIMSMIRVSVPDLWFLSSGINTQDGELGLALKAGLRADGKGMLIHVSTSIARAADTPARAAKDLRDKILDITAN